ncbi:MAG: formate dehydrogenase accessory sulfurtransferase FdhD [Gemmatimonadetes bacterium]|nr:formate dehydrogenase accessory sulfurtransferase FdhD [Gemmatimonadota bacterium]MDE2677577.1 formate dehydrogenase accessory sulfurtransferase FdhD [Gemmatimonadota bacterium]MYA12769.1 formate dehydrogenase accessory sulfurtransferase FdhD [Gemmatimonadota bacterium]MYE69235.1 formate dehydrogenase accessory sulfurtransferase FdhD [Gemmatimonadota bacterium]MYJ68459.1 formate dehydrogenase accessory sulfurtransferase FdhD [Gemmatimonadota bacterium]
MENTTSRKVLFTSQRRAARIRVGRMRGGWYRTRSDSVAVEEPMEVRLEVPGKEGVREHPVSVTMRTPGDDFELAAGFLFTEGVVTDPHALGEVRYCRDVDPQEYNVVTASLRDPGAFDAASLTRNFYVTSSCGVCGKASLESVEVMGCTAVPDGTLTVADADVRALPDRLRSAQRVFDRTGGIHAAGLFDASGRIALVREDVGRHNAVDKVVGALVLSRGLPGSDRGLVVSGRSSFEILQKAAMAGFPMVVAVGAPSSLAVTFARRFNMSLVGFAKSDGYNVYSGAERIAGLGGDTE